MMKGVNCIMHERQRFIEPILMIPMNCLLFYLTNFNINLQNICNLKKKN